MNLKSLLICAIAASVCTATVARSKKKTQPKKNVPAAPAIQPVPADSFSYAVGVAQAPSLKQYLAQREGIDTTYLPDFIEGLNAQVTPQQSKKAIAYAAGLRIAEQNATQVIKALNKQATGKEDTTYVDLATYNRGLSEGLKGTSALTPDSAQRIAMRQAEYYQQQLRQANIDWLEANKKKEGVKTTPSGLQYKVITQGTGALPTDSSEVEVNYEGKLIDGTVFDSSYKRNKPATFRANQVIKGWTEGLQLMPVGSTYEFYIPYELGYGERGSRQIPPCATLVFKVELLDIKK